MSGPRKPPALKAWMSLASTEEQHRFAELAGTTRGTLYQYCSGNRVVSSERAIGLEKASRKLHKSSKGRLPLLYRTDLSPTCAGCEYARQCIGVKADFPVGGV